MFITAEDQDTVLSLVNGLAGRLAEEVSEGEPDFYLRARPAGAAAEALTEVCSDRVIELGYLLPNAYGLLP